MKKVAILLMIFILTYCSGKNGQDPTDIDSLEKLSPIDISKGELPIVSNETKLYYEEINHTFQIIQDETDVYVLPALRSKIKGTLTKGDEISIIGFSEEEGTIKGQNECWIKIYHEQDGTYGGWIPSNSTNIEGFSVSDLQVENSSKDKQGNLLLQGKYFIGNQEKAFSVLAQKAEGQDFYTFWWDHFNEGFHYSNRPGFYMWNENKKELKHISYIAGIDGEITAYGGSIWAIVTNDLKYLVQDYGTAPPPRGIIAWNLDNGEIIFSGQYYEKINLHEHTIEIIKYYDEYYNGKWSNRKNNLTKEEIDFAKKFMETNKPPEELIKTADSGQGNGFALLLVFKYNLDNGETKISGGKYIVTM